MPSSNHTPLISVVMPNYNCEQYLDESISSILHQTFSNFEFIIIDDGSTDKSWEIIRKYAKQDKRIIAIHNKKNLGVHKTRNKLLHTAKGTYIAMMDSDDISNPTRLEKQIKFFAEYPSYGLCGTNFTLIDKTGKQVGEKQFPETDESIKASFFWRNPFGQNTIMMKSEIIDVIGHYDETLEVAEDLDMWIRISTQYKMYNIQEHLVQYRIHGQNSILTRQKDHIKNTLAIRKRALQLGYTMTFKGKVFYLGTRCMQFLPPKIVLWLFNMINR